MTLEKSVAQSVLESVWSAMYYAVVSDIRDFVFNYSTDELYDYVSDTIFNIAYDSFELSIMDSVRDKIKSYDT
jgi:hypothetical protein